MAKNYNQSCDNCGTVLFGQDRGAYVKKDNIFFNGQAGKNIFDPETGWHETVFFTKTKAEQTCFCDTGCLVEWMQMQEQLYQNRKQARLREEVEFGITGQRPLREDRPAWSSSVEPKPRKEYGSGPPAAAPAPAPTAPAQKRIEYGGNITPV